MKLVSKELKKGPVPLSTAIVRGVESAEIGSHGNFSNDSI